jgi:LPXTG-motif cell wall-anchored protein
MPETAFAAARRVLFLLIAVVAMMTASLRPGTVLAAQVPQNRCDVPGKVYTQTIIVDRKNGPIGTTTLFLVCRPSHVVAIVDSDGGTYKDLADFRAHNHLFGAGDTITLPRDFPAVDPSGKRDLVTVSGHTGSSSVWWWVIGGVVLVVAAGGGLLLRARRRRSTAADPDPDPIAEADADVQEP